MKTWSYGTNPLPQFRSGSVYLIEAPWWLLFIEWLIDHSHMFIPPIPFPNFPRRVWFFSDGEETTPEEWYGDLQMLWCSTVCGPVFNWIFMHPRRVEYVFDLGYDKIREVLGAQDEKYFERQDKME
jgi:hypothetical protein